MKKSKAGRLHVPIWVDSFPQAANRPIIIHCAQKKGGPKAALR